MRGDFDLSSKTGGGNKVTSDGEGHAGTAQQTQTSLPMCSAGPSLIGSGDFSKMSPPKWREAFSKQRKKVSVFWPGKASLEPLRGKAQHQAQDLGAAFFPCASSPEAPSTRRPALPPGPPRTPQLRHPAKVTKSVKSKKTSSVQAPRGSANLKLNS